MRQVMPLAQTSDRIKSSSIISLPVIYGLGLKRFSAGEVGRVPSLSIRVINLQLYCILIANVLHF